MFVYDCNVDWLFVVHFGGYPFVGNPPMDQNSPEDVFALQYYLNREQYGDRPLLYGAVYSAQVPTGRKLLRAN